MRSTQSPYKQLNYTLPQLMAVTAASSVSDHGSTTTTAPQHSVLYSAADRSIIPSSQTYTSHLLAYTKGTIVMSAVCITAVLLLAAVPQLAALKRVPARNHGPAACRVTRHTPLWQAARSAQRHHNYTVTVTAPGD